MKGGKGEEESCPSFAPQIFCSRTATGGLASAFAPVHIPSGTDGSISGWLVFNHTFSKNRLYRTMEYEIYCGRAGKQYKHTIKQ